MIDATSFTFLIVVIMIAVTFDFANGFNDSANAIATVVSTRVMSPVAAVAMAAVMNFAGAVSGTAVAKTVGKGVVDPDVITLVAVAGGVGAASIWVFTATRFGMPVRGVTAWWPVSPERVSLRPGGAFCRVPAYRKSCWGSFSRLFWDSSAGTS